MSAIKDIMDLVTQLRNSVQDRKFAAEITQIQSLISAVQLENSSTISENLELKTENFELKKENSILGQHISELEKQQSELTATHTVEIAKLTRKHEEEIQRRDDIIQNENSHNISLDNDNVNILKVLFNTESVAVDEIAQLLNLGLQFVNFHLEEMQKNKMVKQLKIWRENIENNGYTIRKTPYHVPGYAIEQKGRKYLIDIGEIT